MWGAQASDDGAAAGACSITKELFIINTRGSRRARHLAERPPFAKSSVCAVGHEEEVSSLRLSSLAWSGFPPRPQWVYRVPQRDDFIGKVYHEPAGMGARFSGRGEAGAEYGSVHAQSL